MRLGGEGRFDWRRQTLWVGLLALAFFVGAVVWQYTSGPSNGQEVFHVTRGAGSVVDDVSLDRLLGGVAALPADAGVVAYCVNGWYWATDVNADTNVVVASADRYYNAAQAVVDGSFDRELVVAVEDEVFKNELIRPQLEDLSGGLRPRHGDESLDAYLVAVSGPASEATLRRFVVYAASESTSQQRLQFIDLAHRDRDAIRRFMNELGGRSVVRVAAFPERVDVSRDACAPLLAGPADEPPGRPIR